MHANLAWRKPRCRGHGPLLPRETCFFVPACDAGGYQAAVLTHSYNGIVRLSRGKSAACFKAWASFCPFAAEGGYGSPGLCFRTGLSSGRKGGQPGNGGDGHNHDRAGAGMFPAKGIGGRGRAVSPAPLRPLRVSRFPRRWAGPRSIFRRISPGPYCCPRRWRRCAHPPCSPAGWR